jgi:hypothetical protein
MTDRAGIEHNEEIGHFCTSLTTDTDTCETYGTWCRPRWGTDDHLSAEDN